METSGLKINTALIGLITSCAGLAFLGASDQPQLTARQRWQAAHAPVLSKRTGPIKRTWNSGPASLPLDTEHVPSRPPAVPPQTSPLLAARVREKPDAKALQSRFVGPVRVSNRPAVGATAGAKPAYTVQEDVTESADPESARIQNEFVRLRQDAAARRAFYDDLLNTVERERGGSRYQNWAPEKPVLPQPSARPLVQNPTESVNRQRPAPGRENVVTPADAGDPPHVARPDDPAAGEPDEHTRLPDVSGPGEQPTAKPPVGQSWLRQPGIDPIAYHRVVRWAKANGLPVSLALGVAWMESHLNTNAPHGTAGEVGMFQIMPERCRLEGWPPARLSEPEFNAWMGTRLLARYYKEEGSVSRAAAKYVAGPAVFDKQYSKDMWAYIDWYATRVDTYARYFSRYQS